MVCFSNPTAPLLRLFKSNYYVKSYIFDCDKIKAFLGITDYTDGRIEEAMIELIGFVDRETNPIATARRIGAPTDNTNLVISLSLKHQTNPNTRSESFALRKKDIPPPTYLKKLAEPLLTGPDVFEFVQWSLYRDKVCQRLCNRLGQDQSRPHDGRIDEAMIEIIGFVDRETNPIATARRIDAPTHRTNLVILLGPEACGPDLDVLKKKDIHPPTYLKKLAEPLLTGPDVFEFVNWASRNPCRW